MKPVNPITPEYKKRVKKLRKIVRGKYELIAKRAGVSKSTVNSVMIFKFYNESVINEAENLATKLTEVFESK